MRIGAPQSPPDDPRANNETILPPPATRLRAFRTWLAGTALGSPPQKSGARNIALACLGVFLLGIGVRSLYYQDIQYEMVSGAHMSGGLMGSYWHDSRRMAANRSFEFAKRPEDPTDAHLLIHPPGYSIFLAALRRISGSHSAVRTSAQLFQATLDSFGAVIVLLIANEFLALPIAIIAGALAAMSPHMAYHSVWLSPDSMGALLVLLAVLFLIKGLKQSRLFLFILCGLSIGASCWLRGNALLLAPFLTILCFFWFGRKGAVNWIAITAAAALVIAPITVRNWIVFHRFVPLTICGGLNMVQGIAEFDRQGQFGMPLTDQDAISTDVEWFNRPDYAAGLWKPDGIDRDEGRFKHGARFVRGHPGWFLHAMLKRAAFMLSYNEGRTRIWPFNTAQVPVVSRDATFGHSNINRTIRSDAPAWSSPAAQSATGTGAPAPEMKPADSAQEPDKNMSTGNNGGFSFEIENIKENTDYVAVVRVKPSEQSVRTSVTDRAGSVVMSSVLTSPATLKKLCRRARRAGEPTPGPGLGPENGLANISVPFASGHSGAVRLSAGFEGVPPGDAESPARDAQLFELGPTPGIWTRPFRIPLAAIQEVLYTTATMTPLIAAGILLLLLAGRKELLVVLLGAPAYYVLSHAAFSTEYRYILVIHYFLFIMAAIAIFFLTLALKTVMIKLRPRRAA